MTGSFLSHISKKISVSSRLTHWNQRIPEDDAKLWIDYQSRRWLIFLQLTYQPSFLIINTRQGDFLSSMPKEKQQILIIWAVFKQKCKYMNWYKVVANIFLLQATIWWAHCLFQRYSPLKSLIKKMVLVRAQQLLGTWHDVAFRGNLSFIYLFIYLFLLSGYFIDSAVKGIHV